MQIGQGNFKYQESILGKSRGNFIIFAQYYIFLDCRIGEVHFSELEKRSAARREKGHKQSVFWSGKSQGISFLTEGSLHVYIADTSTNKNVLS